LGRSDGTFANPGLGDLRANPFGWGTSALDYDNNGTTDLVYFGHLDAGPTLVTDNPGALLSNDGNARFTRNRTAFAGGTDYNRHEVTGEVTGEATGDLNNDGFPDIITVSAMNIPGTIPLTRFPTSYGSPFDATAYYVEQFRPIGPGAWVWNGYEFPNGTLQIEMNSADNGNGWVKIRTVGSAGLAHGGRVNRDGIGAVVMFTPDNGRTAMQPIVAGSSYASQDSLVADFGLGSARKGTVDIVWPGGVRNRLYDVRDGETIRFPEIPFSYDTRSMSFSQYVRNVGRALEDLVEADQLTGAEGARFFLSAVRAFLDAHGGGPFSLSDASPDEFIPFQTRSDARSGPPLTHSPIAGIWPPANEVARDWLFASDLAQRQTGRPVADLGGAVARGRPAADGQVHLRGSDAVPAVTFRSSRRQLPAGETDVFRNMLTLEPDHILPPPL
jgi:hypothetical protein